MKYCVRHHPTITHCQCRYKTNFFFATLLEREVSNYSLAT